jgi:glucosyl-3-phosphoglycerate synthase
MSSASCGRSLTRLKQDRGLTVAVCLPALNEQTTIGGICREITTQLRDGVGLVDELLVIDCESEDDTVLAAREYGATVFQASRLSPRISFGGKGEALWKSLSATSCDIVVWVDSDVSNFQADWVVRLLDPLLNGRALMTKGSYRRPLMTNESIDEDGGGRVTELVARPLINALWPQLAHLRQPLAGECASFRSLLRDMPFLSGYAVEIGLLVEFAGRYGGDAIADVDLGLRVHRNRPLREVAKMSFEIIHGAAALLESQQRTPSLNLSRVLIQPGDPSGAIHQVDIRRFPPRMSLNEHFEEQGSLAAVPGG